MSGAYSQMQKNYCYDAKISERYKFGCKPINVSRDFLQTVKFCLTFSNKTHYIDRTNFQNKNKNKLYDMCIHILI